MPLNHRRALGCALSISSLVLSANAWAEGPGWGWSVGQQISHDSNLFRLPDSNAPGLTPPRSETLSTTSLDLTLDQPFGRQRLLGRAGVEALRYRHRDELNHDAHQADLRLNWETAGRLSGQLRAASARTLRPLDPRAAEGSQPRNLESTDEAAALIRLGGAGRLTMEGLLGGRSVRYSDPAFDAAELRTQSAGLGLRWRPAGATTFGAGLRETRGRYLNALDDADRYRSRTLDLWMTWTAAPMHRLYLRASPLRARYDQRGERDFSGLTGALAWQWQPRSPWRVTARAVRDLGQDAYLERYGADDSAAQALQGGHVDDGVVLTRLTLAAERAVTAKVQASASLSWTRRTLTSQPPSTSPSIILPAATTAHDTTSQAALGLRWAPRRSIQLGCDASAERRRADGLLSTPYSARVVGCFGRLAW
jgi:hypothetical protein